MKIACCSFVFNSPGRLGLMASEVDPAKMKKTHLCYNTVSSKTNGRDAQALYSKQPKKSPRQDTNVSQHRMQSRPSGPSPGPTITTAVTEPINRE